MIVSSKIYGVIFGFFLALKVVKLCQVKVSGTFLTVQIYLEI